MKTAELCPLKPGSTRATRAPNTLVHEQDHLCVYTRSWSGPFFAPESAPSQLHEALRTHYIPSTSSVGT